MGRISNIEEKLAALVEMPFRAHNYLDPLNIEIALRRLAEKNKKNILGKILIPNLFSIVIDDYIFLEYEPFFDSLSHSLKNSLDKWMKEKGYETVNEITFQFKKGSLDNTSFNIFAYYSNEKKHYSSFSFILPPFNTSLSLQGKECEEGLSVTIEGSEETKGVLRNIKTGEQFELQQGETIIGRSKDCDVTIIDPTVSEMHACIYIKHGNALLEDIGSKNGTRVNWERVSKRIISSGDRITIGCIDFIFDLLYP